MDRSIQNVYALIMRLLLWSTTSVLLLGTKSSDRASRVIILIQNVLLHQIWYSLSMPTKTILCANPGPSQVPFRIASCRDREATDKL
ncbi:hypothetical protein DFP73DRAFT_543953 [Morchella snyderi]|nr:hypothetical protein DFP73DRAFT_543953 [Morchella snyderi]